VRKKLASRMVRACDSRPSRLPDGPKDELVLAQEQLAHLRGILASSPDIDLVLGCSALDTEILRLITEADCDGIMTRQFLGQLVAGLPAVEAHDAAGCAVALNEPRRGALDAHAILAPPVEAQPCGPIVVAVHGVEAAPDATL
jgi:hypothetical protein